MRKKLILGLFLVLSALLSTRVAAQSVVELRMVPTDSLVCFLRHSYGQQIYYSKDDDDKTLLTVKATDSKFVESALAELCSKGYAVDEYDGCYFVLHGQGLATDLPGGYFSEAGSATSDDLLKFVEDRNAVANFQNKIYEIGDKLNRRTSGSGYVRGYVRNVANGEPLVGVTVIGGNSKSYTMTDAYGYYTVSLPIGENTLTFSGYSLDELALKLLVYGDGDLDVLMKETVISLKGAVVSGERVSNHIRPQMGVERINASFVKTIPAAFGEADVLRAVMTLPGVKTVGEASSGFNVRGGSVDQNLILFNDGTIYNPSHMFGVMSAFDTDVISTADLYKSSIPTEFGGRISSVLDIKGRTGNSKKFSGSVGIGLLTSHLELEGPIASENTTFVLGGRTTYSNWLLKLLPENSGYAGGRASFSDINAGISHKFNDRNSIHAFGYWSRDRYSFSGDTTFRYSNASTSLKWRHTIDEKSSLTLTGGYDRYQNAMDQYENFYNAYKYSTLIQEGFLKANFKTVFNEKHTMSYGADVIFYNLDPGSRMPYSDSSLVAENHLRIQRGLQPSLYVSDEWKMGSQFSVDYGLRLSSFVAMGDSTRFYIYPEARISAKYSPLSNLSIKAGFNTMTQYIHLISNSAAISPMDTWQLSSDKIRPQIGFQAAAGVYWTVFDGRVDLSLEGYYKRTYRYLDYMSGATLVMNPNLPDELVETTGRSWGVEFMARKTTGKLTGWVSYTYARAKLKESQDRGLATINNGDWYNAPHDKPHDFKLVGNYKITHRLSVSCNIDYSTGRPVTIPVGVYYYGGGYRLAYSQRNAYRIPDYFRMDLACIVEPSHNLKKLAHFSMTFGCYNVTARKNAYSVYYTTNGGTSIQGYKISVFACPIPYVSFNLKF